MLVLLLLLQKDACDCVWCIVVRNRGINNYKLYMPRFLGLKFMSYRRTDRRTDRRSTMLNAAFCCASSGLVPHCGIKLRRQLSESLLRNTRYVNQIGKSVSSFHQWEARRRRVAVLAVRSWQNEHGEGRMNYGIVRTVWSSLGSYTPSLSSVLGYFPVNRCFCWRAKWLRRHWKVGTSNFVSRCNVPRDACSAWVWYF